MLEATVALLLEGGVEAVTIPAVAARAGVHASSIYRRWGERDALLVEALLERADTEIPIPDTGSLREDLVLLVDEVRRLLMSPFGRALAELLTSSDAASLAELRRTYWAARLARAQAIADRAVERGELDAGVDRRLLFELIVGPLHTRAMTTPGRIDRALPRRIVDTVLDGVISRSGQ